MENAASTRKMQASDLKGGDVLADGREVFDCQPLGFDRVALRLLNARGEVSTFSLKADQPMTIA